MTTVDDDYEEGWVVTRSDLDPRVWVPVPSGFGEAGLMLNAGSLTKVKAWVERYPYNEPDFAWRKIDADRWFYGWPEATDGVCCGDHADDGGRPCTGCPEATEGDDARCVSCGRLQDMRHEPGCPQGREP